MTAPTDSVSTQRQQRGQRCVQCLVRRLVDARENLRWTQADLAKATGLQPAAVSHFETGSRLPSVPNLVRLAKALRVSTDWLLGLTDEQEQPVVEIDGVRYFPSPNNQAQPQPPRRDNAD